MTSPDSAALFTMPTEPPARAFVWTSAFETGISSVDEQHRGLVDIINTIGEQVSESRPILCSDLERHVALLRQYAAHHFAEERELMREAQVWAAHREPHEHQHKYYIAELDRLAAQVATVEREAASKMLRFLSSWLAYHILGIDQAMARQVARIEAGESPRAAYESETDEDNGRTEPLLDALDGLFQNVAERNDALRELNATLEERVAARTLELRVAVQDLEQQQIESKRLSDELAAANRRLETMAMTDVLSGLPNRRHALLKLELAWESAKEGAPFSVIVVDADHFKAVNDTFGHDAGDEVIRALARELCHAVRTDDIVCRMGGDEFLILCPNTDLRGARRVAHDVWHRVGHMAVRFGVGRWQGSVSVGVASCTPETGDVAGVIKAADEAVYRAKAAGRNCVVSAD